MMRARPDAEDEFPLIEPLSWNILLQITFGIIFFAAAARKSSLEPSLTSQSPPDLVRPPLLEIAILGSSPLLQICNIIEDYPSDLA